MSELIVKRINAALEGRYRIEREIGEGGMAMVYLADDLRHGRKVALKVLRPELAATMGPERFLQEVRVTAQLQHPHILPLYDSGEADEFLFYVMPFVDGESLREKLTQERELPIPDAVRILKEVTDALAAAHQVGLVHRDIKPDNVLLSGRHAMVADFGVAKAVSEATGRHKLTTVGVALGTPNYMAPEQASGEENIDHRADIYAVGAMAYEMLCGTPPFTGSSSRAVLTAAMTQPVTPLTEHRPSVPATLEDIILRCLEKKAADRYQSADELLAHLDMLLTPTGITPTATRPITPASWRGGRWAMVAVAAAVVLGGGYLALRMVGWGGGADPSDASSGAVAEAVETTPLIAVVPFQTRGGSDDAAVWADLLAEAVVREIGRAARDAVPWDRVEAAAGGGASIAAIATATGATHVVSGTITTLGTEVRFEVRIHGADGSLIRALDVQSVQAESIAAELDAVAERLAVAAAAVTEDPYWRASTLPTTFDALTRANRLGDIFLCEQNYPRTIEFGEELLADYPTQVSALLQITWAHWNLGDIEGRDAVIARTRPLVEQMTAGERAEFDIITAPTIAEAVRAARRGFAIHPEGFGFILAHRALWANALDLALAALEAYDTANAECGWVDYWQTRVTVHHLRGEYADELYWARDGLERFPGTTRLIVAKALALAQLDSLEAAEETLADFRNTAGPVALSVALAAQDFRRHGHDELYETFRAASLELLDRPQEPESATIGTLFFLGEWERLLPLAEAYVAGTDAPSPPFLRYHAAALEGTGRHTEADRVARRLDETYPSSVSRATLPFMRGQTDEAIRTLVDVVANNGVLFSSSSLLVHRGPWDPSVYDPPQFQAFLDQVGERAER